MKKNILLLTSIYLASAQGAASSAETFFKAADEGDLSAMQLLITDGIPPDRRTESRSTAIHCAAKKGHNHIISFLVANHNFDPDIRGSQNKTALHYAAGSEHLETIRLLLSLGSDSNAQDDYARTPLFIATCRNKTEAAKLLLTFKANIDPYRFPPVPRLGSKTDLNKADIRGYTPLHYAAENGLTTPVALLLQHGAEKQSKTLIRHKFTSWDWVDNATPLCLALIYKQYETARILLEAHADANEITSDDRSLLCIMAYYGDIEGVKLLTSYNADLNKGGINKYESITPLIAAAAGTHTGIKPLETVQHLVEAGADMTLIAVNGCTAFSMACIHNQEHIMDYLETAWKQKFGTDIPRCTWACERCLTRAGY